MPSIRQLKGHLKRFKLVTCLFLCNLYIASAQIFTTGLFSRSSNSRRTFLRTFLKVPSLSKFKFYIKWIGILIITMINNLIDKGDVPLFDSAHLYFGLILIYYGNTFFFFCKFKCYQISPMWFNSRTYFFVDDGLKTRTSVKHAINGVSDKSNSRLLKSLTEIKCNKKTTTWRPKCTRPPKYL